MNGRAYPAKKRVSATRPMNGRAQIRKGGSLGFFFQIGVLWEYNFSIGAFREESPRVG